MIWSCIQQSKRNTSSSGREISLKYVLSYESESAQELTSMFIATGKLKLAKNKEQLKQIFEKSSTRQASGQTKSVVND